MQEVTERDSPTSHRNEAKYRNRYWNVNVSSTFCTGRWTNTLLCHAVRNQMIIWVGTVTRYIESHLLVSPQKKIGYSRVPLYTFYQHNK